MADRSPGGGRLRKPAWASESDASEPCPWCGKGILRGESVSRHYIETADGIAPLAVLHLACSVEQRDHEEDFGDR